MCTVPQAQGKELPICQSPPTEAYREGWPFLSQQKQKYTAKSARNVSRIVPLCPLKPADREHFPSVLTAESKKCHVFPCDLSF